MDETLILKGGTILNGYQSIQADIWIKQGQIQGIIPDWKLLSKKAVSQPKPEQIIDVSGFYILPGFISMRQEANRLLQGTTPIEQQLRPLIEQGITSFMDVLPVDSWLGLERILYLLSGYQESQLDYAIRIGLPAELFTYDHVRELGKASFQWLQVNLHSIKELDRIDWDRLYPYLSFHHVALALSLSKEQGLTPSIRENIVNEWTNTCRYGNIRTLVQDQSKAKVKENDYYQLHQLNSKAIVDHLNVYKQNWYAQYPVLASLEDWREPISTKDWTAEQLLHLLVRLGSANVAKTIGIYPRKGSITPGADADLLLVEKSEWLTKFERYTMLEISEICLPTYVMSNGRWEYLFGKHVHNQRLGQHLQVLKPYNYAI
ncbi:hypothetical protein ACQCN2_04385 [Brevibacillus ginsengisoli]|uniref:hypothetical protein n=1 Tax=Brevibacillus ginsengisoli TaxID=363854 RepID=UPI003CF283D9